MRLAMNDTVRRALATNRALLALGHETFEADGALFVRDRTVPATRDANHVTSITAAAAPAEIDRLLARAEREFAGFPHRRFDVEPDTPPEFEARLQLDGYEQSGALVMVLEGELRGEGGPCDIRPVESEEDWRAYGALHAVEFDEYRAAGGSRPDLRDAMLRVRRLTSPPVRYWLAYLDGAPRSYLCSWEGVDGMGQIESLFTHPDYRHRGLATALIHHCVADARAHGAGPVVIVADPSDTPKRMYAALGFRPVAIKRSYWKNVE
jgi:ribosomal protein S18 acetylase RimI-like enzyme